MTLALRAETSSVLQMLQDYFVHFSVFALALLIDETQCMVTTRENPSASCDALRAIDRIVLSSTFQRRIKYLNIFLSPSAAAICWNGVIEGYMEPMSFLRNSGGGFGPVVILHNVLCASRYSWIVSFMAPSCELLEIESNLLPRMIRTVWKVTNRAC